MFLSSISSLVAALDCVFFTVVAVASCVVVCAAAAVASLSVVGVVCSDW